MSTLGALLFFSIFAFSMEPSGYLIDQVADVYEPTCVDCPTSVGTMFMAKPLLFSEIESSDQISYSNCHLTLTGPDTVLTAAHCLKAWFKGTWKELALNECSKSIAVFFPKTRGYESETVKCKSVEGVQGDYTGVRQLFPDTIEITLERSLNRPFSIKEDSYFNFNENNEYVLWINTPDRNRALTKVTCNLVSDTAFSPASFWNDGAFKTLSCDNDVLSGTSGGGVFSNGKIVANISHGAENHQLSPSLFGYNEVVVSRISCFNSNDAHCVLTPEESLSYLYEYHFKAFDLAFDWHLVMYDNISKYFTYASYSYQKLETGDIIQNRGFYISCIKRQTHEVDSIALGFKIIQERLNTDYVKFDEEAKITGIYNVISSTNRSFYNSVDLIETSDFRYTDRGIEFQSDHMTLTSVPYCS